MQNTPNSSFGMTYHLLMGVIKVT